MIQMLRRPLVIQSRMSSVCFFFFFGNDVQVVGLLLAFESVASLEFICFFFMDRV